MKKWEISKSKIIKTKVTASVKEDVSKIASALVNGVLKPQHIKPKLDNLYFNHLVDIFLKWRGSSLYFCATYNSYEENAISPSFDVKFARLTYVSDDKFNLSYMRHNDKWFELHAALTGQECCDAIKNEPYFVL